MDDLSVSVLFGALLVLILLSAFFSGTETALMTLNRYRLKHAAESGSRSAKLAESLLEKPDRLIGLILLGNNLVNNLAAAAVTVIALKLAGPSAVTIGTLLLTVVMLIFSEVTPKTLAALHPERLAYPAAWVYRPLSKIAHPFVWTINKLAHGILSLLQVRVDDPNGSALTREELRTVVNEAGAMIPSRHQNMLLSILDLEKATVEDIMIPRHEIDAVDFALPIEDIIDFFEQTPYTRFLVYEGSRDHVMGFLSARRLLQSVLSEGSDGINHETLRELIREPYFIPEGTSLHTQLLNFQRAKRHSALVVDEYGDVLGLVTLSDILEEIVGEFTTDPSDSIADYQPQEDGSYLVDGAATVRDLVRATDWELPTDGPKTLNGLILEHMETIPEPGTSLMIAGYPLEVMQIQNNAVKTVRIQPEARREPEALT